MRGAFAIFLAAVVAPAMSLSSANVHVGDTILVTLSGWPRATTIAVCGNEGRNGSSDCDLVGAVGLEPTASGSDTRQLVVGEPPVACPCIVRAFTEDGSVVRTAPIAIAGVTAAAAPARRALKDLAVSAAFVRQSPSLFARFVAWMGGPAHRKVRLTLRNTSSSPLTNVSVNAAVGRSTAGGAPLNAPVIDALAPNERRSEVLSVSLGAPVHGKYQVFGTVYAANTVESFALHTSSTPWGFYLFATALAATLVVQIAFAFASRRVGSDATSSA